jgi:ABC-type polysaccharide/polyol phosphate transport system ATPase subunit
MGDPAIRIEKLSKLYRLGRSRQPYDTLRDQIGEALAGVLRRRNSVEESKRAFWALRDVSLEIPWGEAVGIIGHNGAGKSTLLKLLSRVMEPTSGRAEVYGRVGSLLEVGTGFHPELTGRENIYLNGAILGMKRAEIRSKFDDIVSFAQVERFVDTPVKRYSSGMYVRLGFSVAAHLEPDILIVDEVLAVGDAAFQKKCLGKMTEVAQHGRTVIFTSHNMAALANLCNRSYRLDHGIIVDSGRPVDVIQRYLMDEQPLSQQDLVDHRGRRKDAFPLMRRVRLLRGEEETATFSTDGPFTIEVECVVPSEMTQALNCAFQIRDPNGTWIIGSHTDEYHQPCPNHGGLITFRAHIDRLVLNPGTFTLTLFLDASDGIQTLDSIDNAISFDVVWIPRAGFVPRKDIPLIHCPVRWESMELSMAGVEYEEV